MIRSDENCFLSDYEEAEQKYLNQKKFKSNRQKRSEINDLINKESRIKHGAINLLKVCRNEQIEQNLKLEIAFSESNIKYLKDQLAEINCALTLSKMKNTCVYRFNKQKFVYNRFENQSELSNTSFSSFSSTSLCNVATPVSGTIKSLIHSHNGNESSQSELYFSELIPISIPTTLNNSFSFSPSSSSSKSTPLHSTGFNTPILGNQTTIKNNNLFSLDEFLTKTADIMIYLNLKETTNNMDFGEGFKNFIFSHYRENPNFYNEHIKQFNNFRQSSISFGSEPTEESLNRLFQYYKSLNIIEKRFFQNSQCNHVHFSWYDSINGIESTQKSIQFEKASLLFNCSSLFSQLAAICCDVNDQKLQEQMNYWLKAAGCVNYLNTNFSNSPSLDMSPFMLYIFYDIFISQAYEIKAKLLLVTNNELDIYDSKYCFISFINSSKIYAHIAQIYEQISDKLSNNQPVKSYLPEAWYHLIKVKSFFCGGLSHYFASLALSLNGLENISDLDIVKLKFDSLHDRTKIKSINAPITNLNEETTISSPKNYFQKLIYEQQSLYSSKILSNKKRISLAKSHLRECIILLEEGIRQHSFCRKFSKDDYLHSMLQHYHDLKLNNSKFDLSRSLEKFMQLEKTGLKEFDDELIDLLPINLIISEDNILKPIDPNFDQFDSKDFFNLLGPIKVYSSENELSIPYSCILRKLPNNPTFGITVKGDSPVRINNVDPNSYAYCAGIRQGDYIIAIQDNDVRWSKHSEVVTKIRSQLTSVKLTLLSCKPIPREVPIFCEDNLNNKIKNCYDTAENAILSPTSCKKILSNNFTSDEPDLIENHIWWNKPEKNRKLFGKSDKFRNRIFKLPNGMHSTRSKSPFANLFENNLVTNKISNIVDNNSNILGEKCSKLNNFFRSSNNINSQNCEQNKHAKENIAFWENIKSIKSPITNTITLGRKFKKNILKLSLFNNFNEGHGNQLNDSKKIAENISQNYKMPPLPIKTSKCKKLKNRIKVRELCRTSDNENSNSLINNKKDFFYKTI